VPEPDRPAPVDERARLALDSLRHAPELDDRSSGAAFDPGAWFERLRDAIDQRWPALRARPVPVVAFAVVVVALLGAGGLWILTTGTEGSQSGAVTPLSLPFTTTTVAGGPGLGTGAGAQGPGPGATAVALVVHAAGAVSQPGVHRLPAGSRVADLLAVAGGPTAEADVDRLNLAAPLTDGERVYVPRVGEVAVAPAVGPSGSAAGSPGSGSGGGTGAAPGTPIDLNRATEAELDVLPGVGPATAAAIVRHREANGPFSRVDDLLEVRGIGPAKLESLRDLVRVG